MGADDVWYRTLRIGKANQIRGAVVSNSDVAKFGIPHFKHSHTMFLHEDLLSILYIVDDKPCQVYVIPAIASIATNPSVLPSNISITHPTWEV